MSKMKKISLDDLGGFVYSTNPDFIPPEAEHGDDLLPGEQLLEVHLEKKGRGGKTAVLVKGYEGSADALEELARGLKKYCGVGGTSKAGEIIIQGDVRNKVMEYLQKQGFKTKRVGG